MKNLFMMCSTLLLAGCGTLGAGLAVVANDWESEIDISDSENVATIRGGTRNVVFAHVTCVIDRPVKAKKLIFNAGRMRVTVLCHVLPNYTNDVDFNFEAVAGHDYLVRMHVPGNGAIDLVDLTDHGKLIDSDGGRR